jgi:hypothetical protein
MLASNERKRPKKFHRFTAVLGIGLLMMLFSCTTSNYGKLQRSPEITKIFEDHQVLAEHSYYYSGLQGVPDAIIGLHTNYTIKSKLWQPVDFDSQLLKTWTNRMAYVHLVTPRGAWILAPEGHRIGVWYSARHQTTVRVEKNNHVFIAVPVPPELRGGP